MLQLSNRILLDLVFVFCLVGISHQIQVRLLELNGDFLHGVRCSVQFSFSILLHGSVCTPEAQVRKWTTTVQLYCKLKGVSALFLASRLLLRHLNENSLVLNRCMLMKTIYLLRPQFPQLILL